MKAVADQKGLGGMSFSCRTHKIVSAGLAMGTLAVPFAANASLVTGNDPLGYRTGEFHLQVGAADLAFNGTSYSNNPTYSYETSVTTGAGTQMIFGPALSSGTLIDNNSSFSGGTEQLYRRWQDGYMAYNPGYTSCDRYGCWNYGGYYYAVVTGSGTSGAWAGGTSGILGFRFLDNGWHYGWAELSVADSSFDIGRWAYETVADVGVLAGSDVSLVPPPPPPAAAVVPQNVPEPGTLALLALGAAGLAGFRARRR